MVRCIVLSFRSWETQLFVCRFFGVWHGYCSCSRSMQCRCITSDWTVLRCPPVLVPVSCNMLAWHTQYILDPLQIYDVLGRPLRPQSGTDALRRRRNPESNTTSVWAECPGQIETQIGDLREAGYGCFVALHRVMFWKWEADDYL